VLLPAKAKRLGHDDFEVEVVGSFESVVVEESKVTHFGGVAAHVLAEGIGQFVVVDTELEFFLQGALDEFHARAIADLKVVLFDQAAYHGILAVGGEGLNVVWVLVVFDLFFGIVVRVAVDLMVFVRTLQRNDADTHLFDEKPVTDKDFWGWAFVWLRSVRVRVRVLGRGGAFIAFFLHHNYKRRRRSW
jgi:hypothetical protein